LKTCSAQQSALTSLSFSWETSCNAKESLWAAGGIRQKIHMGLKLDSKKYGNGIRKQVCSEVLSSVWKALAFPLHNCCETPLQAWGLWPFYHSAHFLTRDCVLFPLYIHSVFKNILQDQSCEVPSGLSSLEDEMGLWHVSDLYRKDMLLQKSMLIWQHHRLRVNSLDPWSPC